jgi:hypothetical protein
MLRIAFAHIRPEKEERLRAWLKELDQRRSEVLETFRQETTRHEQVFIIRGEKGPLLVYAMEAEDHSAVKAAFESSELKIDVQHRDILRECISGPLLVTPDFDCAAP